MTRSLFTYALFISILLHLSFGGVLSLSKKWQTPLQQKNLEFSVVSQPSTANTDRNNLQIVEQGKTLNEMDNPNAKYLSRQNHKVVRETKAAPGQAPSSAMLRSQSHQTSSSLPTAKVTEPTVLKNLLPSYDKLGLAHREFEPSSAPPKTQGLAESLSPGNIATDHLKDVETGLETMLNTREFVFYSYYDRIRGRLRQYWEPKIRDKVSKVLRTGRRIASHKDHITKIVITLNSTGDLIRVQVIEESGIHDLDEAAIEAFRAAAPFPNPPKGIVSQDGTIQIRWDFVLES